MLVKKDFCMEKLFLATFMGKATNNCMQSILEIKLKFLVKILDGCMLQNTWSTNILYKNAHSSLKAENKVKKASRWFV